MKPSLTVILGSSADIFYGIDSYPSEGDFTHAREVTKSAGGPPLNAGCVCASKGGRVNALDCLNPKDETTEIILEALSKNGVNTDAIVYDESCTNGKVLIFNHEEKRTMFVIDPVRPKYEKSVKIQNLLNESTYLYSLMHIVERSFDGYDMIRVAKEHGARMIFDGTSKYEDRKRAELLLEMADGLFINTTDYERLKDCLGEEPWEALIHRGCEFVCVTDGSRGASCYTKDGVCFAESLQLDEIIDSTGAGDAFAGCFLYGKLNGWNIERCLRYACAGGAYACMHYSGLGGCCSDQELREFADFCHYELGENK